MAETYTSLTDPRDWRGVPITVGALVIYGAPVSRSIAMVEATVEGFTKSGRVNVRIIRRAYGSYYWRDEDDSKEVVHVGQDRLTVVNTLPEPLMGTEADKREQARLERIERQRVRATHDIPQVDQGQWDQECTRCGTSWRESFETECPGVAA